MAEINLSFSGRMSLKVFFYTYSWSENAHCWYTSSSVLFTPHLDFWIKQKKWLFDVICYSYTLLYIFKPTSYHMAYKGDWPRGKCTPESGDSKF